MARPVLTYSLLLIAAFVGGVAIFFWNNWPSRLEEIGTTEASITDNEAFLIDVQNQRVTERVFREIQYTPQITIGDTEETRLLNPIALALGEEGFFYVLDYKDSRVKQYSSSGQLYASYGNDESAGPGDAFQAIDFMLAPDGKIWITDQRNPRLFQYSSVGVRVNTVKLDSKGFRLARLAEGRIALLPYDAKENLLLILDTHGKIRKRAVPIAKQQEKVYMSLFGELESDPNGESVILTSHYGGLIVRFDADGAIIYARRTINPPPFPIVRKRVSRGLTVKNILRDDVKENSRGNSITENEIHLLWSSRLIEGQKSIYIDVYDLQTGDYRYSYRAPSYARDIIVTGDLLYTAQDSTVTLWQRQ